VAYLALEAVQAAVQTVLNVPALLALAPGGVHAAVPQMAALPFVLVTVSDDAQHGGFGTRPGAGALSQIGIRVAAYSDAGGMTEAQRIAAKVIELLVVPGALEVDGYDVCGLEPFYGGAIPVGDELIAGQSTQEVVAEFRLFVEET
jgi:hypothetical protein